MLIVVAGIKRSGSTAQFNMIRLVLETFFGKEYVYTTGDPKVALNLNSENRIVLIKYHPFDKRLFAEADFIFTTSRPIEEVKDSMLRFYGVNNMPKRGLSVMQRHLRNWRSASFNQTFSEIVNLPINSIRNIIGYIGIEEDVAEEVYHQFRKVKPPESGYDKETFLFSNHITK